MRKGYKKIEDQVAANKRYLENNIEARERKKISNLKSNTKNFIKNYASTEDLREIKILIQKRLEIL